MGNEKQTSRRLLTLAQCADVLDALRDEMPQASILIGQAKRQVVAVREAYEAQIDSMRELAESERKPPMRVTAPGRRKQTARVTFTDRTQPNAPLDSMHRTDVGDYDMEQEQEMRDRFGDDIPDGSD